MERGIISLGSSLMYLQQRMNTTANNIANSDTAGFKRDKTIGRSFNSFLSHEFEKYYSPVEIRWNSGMVDFKPGVYANRTYTDLSQGRMEETGKNSDIALLGRGFIALQNGGEEVFKRCVSLFIDDQGYLADRTSGRLLGVDGYIRTGLDEFFVDDIGNVTSEGIYRGRIRLVDFVNTDALVKRENGVFADPSGNGRRINGAEAVFVQGSTEGSNADMAKEMVDLTDVFRKYETSQRMLQMLDQIYAITVNDLGKV